MKQRGNGSRGAGRNVVLAALALGAVAAFAFRPKAEATQSRTERLGTVWRDNAGDPRRLMAIDGLGSIDSSASRHALKDLADSADDRIAVTVIGVRGHSWPAAARAAS